MSFESDLERGRVGERLVIDTFKALGYEVRDTSKDSDYFADDVDLIAADGIKYEVKTDYRFSSTGNLALEASVYYYASHERKDSWLYTSGADYFCFVNPRDLSRFVTIKASTLRELVEMETLRHFDLEGGYKSTRLYLLPYDKYKSLFEVIDTEV